MCDICKTIEKSLNGEDPYIAFFLFVCIMIIREDKI